MSHVGASEVLRTMSFFEPSLGLKRNCPRQGLFVLSVGFLCLSGGCGGRTGLETWGRSEEPNSPAENWDPVGQLDLLFVIDNSTSMADKQQLLARAVPEMVQRLVDPLCVSPDGETSTPLNGSCPAGQEFEFAPLADIHVGMISTSLGGHGSGHCSREENTHRDDRGRLLPSIRPTFPDGDGLGFLTWSGGDEQAAAALVNDFSSQVSQVGETGCGIEAPLEAFYRFLIDPQPPQEIVLRPDGTSGSSVDAEGKPLIDQEVLRQREAFLRPQSLVNIVVLTDENDCSVMDGGTYYQDAGFGYLVGDSQFSFPIATSECGVNPNDKCCFSCLRADNPPEGCEGSVAACGAGGFRPTVSDDWTELRCFQMKRRFGFDLLYPVSRYVDGLSQLEIVNARDGEMVQNPLLTGVGANVGVVRPKGRVYVTGIVGVPWQDLVTEESLEDPTNISYLTAEELGQEFQYQGERVDRWDVMLGNPGLDWSDSRCQSSAPPGECGRPPSPPLDPFMIESDVERQAGRLNPLSGDAIVASTSEDPLANAINGHEHGYIASDAVPGGAFVANEGLQYACIYPLDTPRACSNMMAGCDCSDEPVINRSVCQPPEGGRAGATQHFAKAFPGTRVLRVLRDFGKNSIVGSICPANPSDGYGPIVSTMVRRMKERFPRFD